MVETLKDGALADKTAAMDFLTRIDNEIDRLTQIVSEITELSRIESGSVELKLEPTDLNHLVEGVIEQLNTLAGRQDITITSRLEPKLPAVSVDSDRIRQTVINLVHNAIKFNRPGGRVIISTKTDSQFVTVSVSDTGIGIPKEDMPYVFERFYKADKARSKGGSGLGLAIARHTVKAHNGTIRVESEQGKGSVFTFSLPIKTATKSAVL